MNSSSVRIVTCTSASSSSFCCVLHSESISFTTARAAAGERGTAGVRRGDLEAIAIELGIGGVAGASREGSEGNVKSVATLLPTGSVLDGERVVPGERTMGEWRQEGRKCWRQPCSRAVKRAWCIG